MEVYVVNRYSDMDMNENCCLGVYSNEQNALNIVTEDIQIYYNTDLIHLDYVKIQHMTGLIEIETENHNYHIIHTDVKD